MLAGFDTRSLRWRAIRRQPRGGTTAKSQVLPAAWCSPLRLWTKGSNGVRRYCSTSFSIATCQAVLAVSENDRRFPCGGDALQTLAVCLKNCAGERGVTKDGEIKCWSRGETR